MGDIIKLQISRSNSKKWIGNVIHKDLNTLPLILVGLNYLKYYPTTAPSESFSQAFKKQCPGMIFYQSRLSDKTIAAGIKEVAEDPGFINLVYHYEEAIPEITDHPLFKMIIHLQRFHKLTLMLICKV